MRIKPDAFDKARNYAYRLLSYRPRSKKEIIGRLAKRRFSRETITAVVNYLSELNYINDSEFACAWVRNRVSTKPMGIFLLKQELKEKGISNEVIEGAIEAVGKGYDEYRIAKGLFLSRSRIYSHLDRTTSRRRIYGYLKRRGFSSEVISKLMVGSEKE